MGMLKRLPNRQAILQVYAVIAVMLSGWTITAFLWKLSAWLLILNIGEIFTVFAYAMVVNLIESLIILLFLLLSCAVLSPSFLRDHFAVRGTILAAGLIGSLNCLCEISYGVRYSKRVQVIDRAADRPAAYRNSA